MSTYEELNTASEQIDITEYLYRLWNSFRKIWYVFLFLPLILAGLNYFRVSRTYVPNYVAEATVSVSVTGVDGSRDNNAKTAEQLGKIFPYILTSSALKDIIADDLEMNYVPGNITVNNVKGTNLLTIKVSGSDPNLVYEVLQSVIRKYPEVAQHVVGRTIVEIIDDAGIPSDSGKTVVMRGSIKKGIIAGLILAVFALLFYIMTFSTILTSKDLKSITNIPYLGTLPIYHKKKRRNSEADGINILKDNTQKDYLEAMRVIRTRLDRSLNDKHVLMVTSSLPGEGKSTVAVNLALAFAMQGKNVVLIDCDLRNPSIQQVLNIKGDVPGLAKLLKRECKLTDTLISYEKKDLNLILLPGTFGEEQEHPELLRRNEMNTIIETLKKVADIIILDTPPSAMLADAEMVVNYSDSALYVVMCDYARVHYIQKGIRELSDTGIPITGIILNAGRQSSSSGYGSYGKNSYYMKSDE